MAADQPRHHRRSIRLKGYDYASAGAYFVTICTANRAYLFGEVAQGEMHLNDLGRVVAACWVELPSHYPHVQLDAFVVMPNHVHCVIFLADRATKGGRVEGWVGLTGPVGTGLKPVPTAATDTDGTIALPAPADGRHGLPEIVRALKTFSSRGINNLRGVPGVPVWQRNYYEHIIRDEDALERIRRYVHDNPSRWAFDDENPLRATG